MTERVKAHELRIEEIEHSSSWIIVGQPGSGKSTLMEQLVYYNRHRFPAGKFFVGSETGYERWCKIAGALFTYNEYDAGEEQRLVTRQRRGKLRGGTQHYAVNMLDDITADSKILKTDLVRSLFKIGSRHWDYLLMLGSQYVIDFPTDIRTSASYVAIFREPDEKNRKRLYENFGGACGTYADFNDYMDALTGDYKCMIIKKRTQSNNREDCVFWFRTSPMKDWKFGAPEVQKWHKERYNTD